MRLTPAGKVAKEISAVLNAAGESDLIQVLNLRRVSVILQMRVLKTGQKIYCRDEILYADFVEQIIKQYCDFAIDYREITRDFDAGIVRDVP